MVRVPIKIGTQPVNGGFDARPDFGWQPEKIGVKVS
jgi:hypothetical protein